MTTIKIYPFWGETNMENLAYYATQSGLTVVSKDKNTLVVSQTLNGTQQTTIRNIFTGTAYVEFA